MKNILQNLQQRSRESRARYIESMRCQSQRKRENFGCANLAHSFADERDKVALATGKKANFAIVTTYSDMLSAHKPFFSYNALLKRAVMKNGANAQVAGSAVAMCDGITQGTSAMELSLFSRDLIAQSTAVALSHGVFDGAFLLGSCDKIAPGLLMGALRFGYLPACFVPAGAMSSGVSNKAKSKAREDYATGKITKEALLQTELGCYHESGICTFYGTANSNQMILEALGLVLPNSAFLHPSSVLREKLVEKSGEVLSSGECLPLYEVVNEKSLLNAVAFLCATGGSTNETLHLVAIAKMAGLNLTWEDFDKVSRITPLLARIYPNGEADINGFVEAGGISVVASELTERGLLFEDALNFYGKSTVKELQKEPFLDGANLSWREASVASKDASIIGHFDDEGGLRLLRGNVGESFVKISAVKERYIKAPARVFTSQDEFFAAFKAGKLREDFVAVVAFCGPKACGMPELHKLITPLGALQNEGHKVALLTDGRLSGASGKVLSAIHVSPEAASGGNIAKIRDGDVVEIDAARGVLNVLSDGFEEREVAVKAREANLDFGRELFGAFRDAVSAATEGATIFGEL